MSSNIYVTVEFTVGSDIKDACAELVSLAQRLGTRVQANFNGVNLIASPDTDRALLAARWNRAMASTSKFKIASA